MVNDPGKYRPVYLRTYREGLLQDKIRMLNKLSTSCTICPHKCSVDRVNTTSGKCHSGILPVISSYGPHYGEEPPLSGFRGSGTIFFTNCNLQCIFCQNYDISQCGEGREVSFSDLAKIMIQLQNQGCHNINLVSPTHFITAILNALPEAIEMGLRIPLVYNSGGYDRASAIRVLDGVIDIYMPDIKYMDDDLAHQLSGVEDYTINCMNAVQEMFRQVGDLQVDGNGIAKRGMIIRHLLLPNNLANTYRVIDYVHSLSTDTYFNLMDQYRPAYKAGRVSSINRRPSPKEFQSAYEQAVAKGLTRQAN